MPLLIKYMVLISVYYVTYNSLQLTAFLLILYYCIRVSVHN